MILLWLALSACLPPLVEPNTQDNPADDFHPTFVGGDTNGNGLLDPGEDWRYTAQAPAIAGQYENRVVTTGVGNLSNTPITSSSISHYFAAPAPVPAISIVKQTNGQVATREGRSLDQEPVPTRANAIAIRGSAEGKEWLEGFAAEMRSKPTSIIDLSLARLAAAEGYPGPPPRIPS